MKLYKPHPAAQLFPMMKQPELRELAKDIQTNKLREPIVLFEDKVLDGRNRQGACQIAKVEPKYVTWTGHGSPIAYVISKNLRRRHLNESQRAIVAARALPLLEKEARARKGNRAPGPASGRARDVAGAVAGVGGRTVARAKALMETAPQAELDAIAAGDKTLKQVEREQRREVQVKQARTYTPPEGEFEVVVIDPPWPYDDQLDGSDAARGGTPYPSMEIEQIGALELPLAENAAVFLWVTNSHLIDPHGYGEVAAAWRELHGLVPKGIATWEKDRIGLGRYFRNKTEHLVLLVRGKPVFTEEKPWSHFRAPVGEHSEKPEAAYLAIEKFCASTSRLEMFARAPRKGWVTSGSELAAAAPAELSDPLQDVEQCGAQDGKPGPKNGPCFLGKGHEHAHSNGRRTWPDKKRKLQPIKEIIPEGMGGPHDWQPVSSVQFRCSRCRETHSAVGKPRLGCFAAPAESMADKLQRDEAAQQEPIPFDAIAWTAKVHPVKVAAGLAPSGRKYAVDRVKKTLPNGKKGLWYVFRWFCVSDGASSMKEFDTVEQAQANAGHAEQEWQRAKAGAA